MFMSKAAELAKKLEHVDIAAGIPIIEESYDGALHFKVIKENSMCVMHDDGSVNIFELIVGSGRITTEVISAENILKVLHHYRPFKEIFKGNVQ
jgi:hypothetical protein